jgi:hypothetical protein
MSIIHKPFTFIAGQAAVASQMNSNFDTLYAEVNGQLTAANIKTNQWLDTKTFYFAGPMGTTSHYFIFRNGSHGGNGVIRELGACFSKTTGGAVENGVVEVDVFRITNPAVVPTAGMTQLNATTLIANTKNIAGAVASFVGLLTANSTFLIRLTPVQSGGADFNGEDISAWITYSSAIFAP